MVLITIQPASENWVIFYVPAQSVLCFKKAMAWELSDGNSCHENYALPCLKQYIQGVPKLVQWEYGSFLDRTFSLIHENNWIFIGGGACFVSWFVNVAFLKNGICRWIIMIICMPIYQAIIQLLGCNNRFKPWLLGKGLLLMLKLQKFGLPVSSRNCAGHVVLETSFVTHVIQMTPATAGTKETMIPGEQCWGGERMKERIAHS